MQARCTDSDSFPCNRSNANIYFTNIYRLFISLMIYLFDCYVQLYDSSSVASWYEAQY